MLDHFHLHSLVRTTRYVVWRLRLHRAVTLALLGALAASGSIGCGMDSGWVPESDPERLHRSVRVNLHAVQLSPVAPNNTLQLTATSYTPSGSVLIPPDGETLSPVQWFSTDSSKVKVTADGLVTAIDATTGVVRVIASRQVNNVTKADTCQIRVLLEPASRVFERLSILPLDSSRMAANTNKVLPVFAIDTADAQMNGVVAYFTTSDTAVAKITSVWSVGAATTSVTIGARKVGKALVTATTWIYGVERTDTFTMNVGYPILTAVSIQRDLQPDGSLLARIPGTASDIGIGGEVRFANATGRAPNTSNPVGYMGIPIDVVFDDPSVALPSMMAGQNTGGGNILAISGDTVTSTSATRILYRRFTRVGIHRYTVRPLGLTGAVTVRSTPE